MENEYITCKNCLKQFNCKTTEPYVCPKFAPDSSWGNRISLKYLMMYVQSFKITKITGDNNET